MKATGAHPRRLMRWLRVATLVVLAVVLVRVVAGAPRSVPTIGVAVPSGSVERLLDSPAAADGEQAVTPRTTRRVRQAIAVLAPAAGVALALAAAAWVAQRGRRLPARALVLRSTARRGVRPCRGPPVTVG